MTRGAVVVVVLAGGCGFQISAGEGASPIEDAAIDGPIDAVTDGATDAPDPVAAFSGIDGEQWLLPCIANLGNRNCTSQVGVITHRSVVIGGTGAEHWLVTIRIRGAMEAITYTGGITTGSGWHVGGAPGDSGNNYYKLDVTQPPATYWLNEGTPTAQRSFRYDYTVQVPIHGGATVVFRTSGQDDRQWGNYDAGGNPIVIAGVTTTPSPYDGQFAQLDVVGAILQ